MNWYRKAMKEKPIMATKNEVFSSLDDAITSPTQNLSAFSSRHYDWRIDTSLGPQLESRRF